jgi:hypothetical protein
MQARALVFLKPLDELLYRILHEIREETLIKRLPVYNDTMSAKKTTMPLYQPRFLRFRHPAQANIVLQARYLARNMAGMIVETPRQLFWLPAQLGCKASPSSHRAVENQQVFPVA